MAKYYECGICDHLHPWDWSGDCRDDRNRFTNDILTEGDEVLSMDDCANADSRGWRVARWYGRGQEIIRESDGMTILRVVHWDGSDPESVAAQRLAAAAPELFAALRDCADRLGEMDCGPELSEARAAIFKAEHGD